MKKYVPRRPTGRCAPLTVTAIACSMVLPVFELAAGEPDPESLSTVVVTATRLATPAFDIPATVHVLDLEDMATRRQIRTVPEALAEVPGVMVQKTGYGQGSPYLRGFTGFRTLFLIDGIRLNNSVFRDGPNQYWNTVDPLSLGRIEIVKGPGSVLFGSDAIGGTVNAMTRGRDPVAGNGGFGGRSYYRFSDAEQAHELRGELSYSDGDAFALSAGYSLKDFGDFEGGEATGVHPMTGYDERDADLRVVYRNDNDTRFTLAHQRVSQDDVWRTHSTVFGVPWRGTTVGSDLKRALDQERRLTYLRVDGGLRSGLADRYQVSLSHQQQDEQRDRIRSDDRRDIQGVDVDTAGFAVQFEKDSSAGTWVYGLDYYQDSVDSFRRDFNADGSLRGEAVQGPVADDASYRLAGVFVQDQLAVTDRLDVTVGARYTVARADADKVADPLTGAQTSLSDDWDALVGSVRFRYAPSMDSAWRVYGGVSQGFRAPNLSDLTRLDTARSNEIETPVTGLDPERYVAWELGLKTRGPRLSTELAVYYTDITDLIVRTPTGREIDGAFEVTKRNSGDGRVRGAEAAATWRIAAGWSVFGAAAWMDGEAEVFPTSAPVAVTEPLDRLMPRTLLAGLRWRGADNARWLELSVQDAIRQDRLSSRDRQDTQRIPPGGTPGYTVFNLRSGWRLADSLWLSAAVNNLTDEDYRVHGSGVNEPGRNLLVTLDWRFRP